MTRQAYTYTILRYVHDRRTGEFLNVGVVLVSESDRKRFFRVRRTFGRAKSMFPDLDSDAFKNGLASVERALTRVKGFMESSGFNGASGGDALALAQGALPRDDSSLQWSPLSSGTTEDCAKTFDQLYARLVNRYDANSPPRRTDADVWRPVRDLLEQRSVKLKLEEKKVVGSTDEISFKHAWKNGAWHAYEPLSFDLADSDGIKDKARKWRGHLDAVADGASEKLQLHFFVGAPQRPELRAAYVNALSILRQAEFHPAIFEEHQIDAFVDEIEDEVRTHLG